MEDRGSGGWGVEDDMTARRLVGGSCRTEGRVRLDVKGALHAGGGCLVPAAAEVHGLEGQSAVPCC